MQEQSTLITDNMIRKELLSLAMPLDEVDEVVASATVQDRALSLNDFISKYTVTKLK
jgi:hypothetical protein